MFEEEPEMRWFENRILYAVNITWAIVIVANFLKRTTKIWTVKDF